MITTLRRRLREAAVRAREVRPRSGASAIRVVAGLAALGCIVVVPSGGLFTAAALVTAVVALGAPAQVGAAPFVAVCLLGWAFGYGRGVDVPIGRTLTFALLLFVVHLAVALAAAVPRDAVPTREVVLDWCRSAWPAVAATPVVGALTVVVGRPGDSQLWDVIGVGGGLLVIVCLMLLARTLRR